MVKRAWTQACRSKGSPVQRGRMVAASGCWKLSTDSELSLLMLALVEGESQVSGQVVIINPVIAGPPIRFGEHPTVGISGDGDAALMHRGVVPLTQQRLSRESASWGPRAACAVTGATGPLGPGRASQAGRVCLSFSMLCAAQIKRHSLCTAVSPRQLNRRYPRLALMLPKTGSMLCCRLR